VRTIPLSELENLSGAEPGELYLYAKQIAFKVIIWGDGYLPTNLNKNTLYCRLNDFELVERVWVNEDHLDFSK
jgi:hypothetical protein